MNIKDGYISKKVTFNTQDGLKEKIDRLMSMMCKLTAQDHDSVKQFKPKIYQSKRRQERDNQRQETFMIDAIMVKEIIKTDIDQIVETEEFSLVVKYNMDKIIEIALGMIRTIGEILEEEILEGM